MHEHKVVFSGTMETGQEYSFDMTLTSDQQRMNTNQFCAEAICILLDQLDEKFYDAPEYPDIYTCLSKDLEKIASKLHETAEFFGWYDGQNDT